MHVPDGFFSAPVSVGAAMVAAGGVALCLRKAKGELDERTAPLAGAVAAFIFAVQMINFPIGLGTSGHLMGGALAAILVGPYAGALCVTVVLIVQGLVLADGGLTALGINVVLMAFVTASVGWLVFRLVTSLLPKTRASAVTASFVGAVVSVPAAALVFVALFAIGGNADLPMGQVAVAMTGIHTLIGIGEGLITAATIAFVASIRPDLVYGLRGVIAREQQAALAAGAS
jgi:cobalt/nickel transport system permease protein